MSHVTQLLPLLPSLPTSFNFAALMTLTEKILARALGKSSVQAGDNIWWLNADVLMTHDVCGPGFVTGPGTLLS